MDAELDRVRQLTAALKQNLELCAKEATVDAVHDIRTGTRRIEAMLDTMLRERVSPLQGDNAAGAALTKPDDTALLKAAQSWLRLLKKIRRTAAPVRDLDVHRKLLLKFKRPKKTSPSAGTDSQAVAQSAESHLTSANPTDAPANPVQQQSEDLDAWLKHTRQDHAGPLVKGAPKWAHRVEAQLAALEEALGQHSSRRKTSRNAAITALDAFARLSSQMQQLDAGNLHDFRKGAKKARYMAESGGDEQAGAVGKALKKLQDEIGDWHDWLMLAEEAHEALGEVGAQLTALIEAQRDRHYTQAMHITVSMRGRLLGEWQALSTRRRSRPPAPRLPRTGIP
jgi:CHAD domain-containing protein